MSLRVISAMAVLLAGNDVIAATTEEIMRSRYLRYSFCMSEELGQQWWSQPRIDMRINRWGVSEPTEQGIAAASRQARARDELCRSRNDLADQPRPAP